MRSNRFASWLVLGCLLLVASCSDETTVPSNGPVGHVVMVKGEVRAQRADQKERLVRVDETVFADDTIITGEAANVQILIKHNGALWELGENSSRRIDKGIAFRAKTKGVAPLDRKEAVATAAAGRNTTREAAASVGTVIASDNQPVLLDEERRENTEAAKSEAPTKGRANPTAARRSKRTSAPPPRQLSPSSASASGSGARSSGAPVKLLDDNVDKDEAADDDARIAPPAPPPVVAPAPSPGATSPSSELRAYLMALIRKCHKKHGGKGALEYERKANEELTVSSRSQKLRPLVTCVRQAVGTKAPPNQAAVSGTVQLP